MTTRGLIVTMEAQAGKEQEVERFLTGAQGLVEEEPGTVAWFAVRIGPSTFGIFDVFDDEAGRDAHLNGRVAEALFAQADSLFSSPPSVQKLDVLADKLPAGAAGAGHTDAGGGWEASEWSGERSGGPAHDHVPGTDDAGANPADADADADADGGWSASEWSNTDRPRE